MPNWLSNAIRSGKVPAALGGPSEPSIVAHVNAVYYPNWKIYTQCPPSRLNIAYVSHVFYAFAWPNEHGTVSLSDDWADTQIEVDGASGCIAALMRLKSSQPQLKILLSLGGGGKGSALFPQVANNEVSRQVFSKSVRDLVDRCHFDGVDIDWEYPADARQGTDYVHLLSCLRALLPSPDYSLTSALPSSQWALRYINLVAAASSLDFINLMTYDFSGPWVDTAGHHAQLFTPKHPHNEAASISCTSGIELMVSNGVPTNKIVVGIPAYGRSFLGAKKIGQAFSGSGGEEGTFEYKDLPRPSTKEEVDKSVGAAFCVGGDGGFVSYDNPETVKMKASLVRKSKLGGLFYWTGTADVRGSRSLIETGYNSMHCL